MTLERRNNRTGAYWDQLADTYQSDTAISCGDFHYGPLLPGDRELSLLPESLSGLHCLEVGCGAGQNSIFLARQGAECTALDGSEKQLAHGRRLAKREEVEVHFQQGDMDHLPVDTLGLFDLVHSTYALPFSTAPEQVIRDCARLLKPGGCFLLVTSHPAYSGEWVELDEEEDAGVLIRDYFQPIADIRTDHEGHPPFARRSTPCR